MKARRSAAVCRFVLVPLACLAGTATAPELFAQEIDALPTITDRSGSASAPSGVFGALGAEARLYLDDARSLLTTPLHWGSEDRLRAAGVVGLVGGLMIFDERLASESQERRSSFTNRVSRITTGLGSADAFVLSGSLLASGIIFHERRLSLMGREAIEASLFSGLITSILKPAFGRQRPVTSNNETVFEPGSRNYSFPSGHSTEAFSVASVVAARSEGWVVPTLAYTAASFVAFDRVNDRAHFPSDVVAGAAIGVVVGRFIVHRHENAGLVANRADISLTAIPHGVGFIARF